MTRALIVLAGDRERNKAVEWIRQAPVNARVEIKFPRRSLAQNSLLWVLLTAFADQLEHFGRKYDAETWKCVMMKALGKELQFVPSLDGDEIVALGYRSSELSKEEMSDLIELLYSEGAKRGVRFHDDEKVA